MRGEVFLGGVLWSLLITGGDGSGVVSSARWAPPKDTQGSYNRALNWELGFFPPGCEQLMGIRALFVITNKFVFR